jgi:hypothetical protein
MSRTFSLLHTSQSTSICCCKLNHINQTGRCLDFTIEAQCRSACSHTSRMSRPDMLSVAAATASLSLRDRCCAYWANISCRVLRTLRKSTAIRVDPCSEQLVANLGQNSDVRSPLSSWNVNSDTSKALHIWGMFGSQFLHVFRNGIGIGSSYIVPENRSQSLHNDLKILAFDDCQKF